MEATKIGSARCADCGRTHDIGKTGEMGRLVQMDPCIYPLHCMDCKKAYETSRVKGSTGLCTGCAKVRENAMRAYDRLKERTSRR